MIVNIILSNEIFVQSKTIIVLLFRHCIVVPREALVVLASSKSRGIRNTWKFLPHCALFLDDNYDQRRFQFLVSVYDSTWVCLFDHLSTHSAIPPNYVTRPAITIIPLSICPPTHPSLHLAAIGGTMQTSSKHH